MIFAYPVNNLAKFTNAALESSFYYTTVKYYCIFILLLEKFLTMKQILNAASLFHLYTFWIPFFRLSFCSLVVWDHIILQWTVSILLLFHAVVVHVFNLSLVHL